MFCHCNLFPFYIFINFIFTSSPSHQYFLHNYDFVPLSGELKFESNKKGLFILRTYKKKWKVYASDPTQTETSMEVILNGNKREIKLPEGEYKGTVAMFSE